MASFYSVIRFVPSALAEEFINIGVLTFGDGNVRGKFLDDWSRVESFAQSEQLVNARAFQEWVEQSMVEGGWTTTARTKPIDEAAVRRIAADWQGSLQVTTPRASMLNPDDLLEDIAPTFLIEPGEIERVHRAPAAHSKHHMVAGLKATLEGAVANRIGKDQHVIVSTKCPVSADMRARKFDVVVMNGAARCAAQCFNFDVSDPYRVLDQVDASAFAMQDVRRRLPNLPLAMVVSNQTTREDAHEIARKAAQRVDAQFIVESQVEAWAGQVVDRIALELNA